MAFTFDVAISYVSPQQALASRISSALRVRGLKVFFDRVDVETIVGREGPSARVTLLDGCQSNSCISISSAIQKTN